MPRQLSCSFGCSTSSTREHGPAPVPRRRRGGRELRQRIISAAARHETPHGQKLRPREPRRRALVPGSWRNYEAKQIPKYDEEKFRKAEEELAGSAPLVFAGEVRTLMSDLGRACKGDGFVIFGGDCAESFDEFSVDHVRDTFRVILQMALICTYGGGQPVIKIGAWRASSPSREVRRPRRSTASLYRPTRATTLMRTSLPRRRENRTRRGWSRPTTSAPRR